MISEFMQSVFGSPVYFQTGSDGRVYFVDFDWQYIASILIFLVMLWGCIKLFTVLLRSIH